MDIPKRKSIWDNIMTGIMAGFVFPIAVSPLIALGILSRSAYEGGLSGFYDQIFQVPSSASSLISLAVLCNLILFFIFYKLKWDSINKGVIFSSIIYAVSVFVLKLV